MRSPVAAIVGAVENALSPFGAKISRAPVAPSDILAMVKAAKTAA
jgi:hypothetical protein